MKSQIGSGGDERDRDFSAQAQVRAVMVSWARVKFVPVLAVSRNGAGPADRSGGGATRRVLWAWVFAVDGERTRSAKEWRSGVERKPASLAAPRVCVMDWRAWSA